MKSLWFAAALAATTASAEQVGLDASGSQLAFDVGAGSVDEVGAWLDTVSFADLKRSFAKHVIDGAALREITEEELKELGVKKVGSRKLFGRLLCEALPDCERPDLTAADGELNVSAFDASEVGNWLESEGFGEAKKAFAANGVDGAAVLDLNEDELKTELGMSKLGSRRRFARTLCAVMPGCRNPRRADAVAAWSAAEVADWLQSIGMGKYAKAFAKHEVDGLTLPDISEEELKTVLGVVEIGLRKRFRTQLCKLDKAFCPKQAEAETELGGDLAEYVQKAQAYLQQRAAEKAAAGSAEAGAAGEVDIAELIQAATGKAE